MIDWDKTEEHYSCRNCGHIGPAEAKLIYEVTGADYMYGGTYTNTGEYRCPECTSRQLDGFIPEPDKERDPHTPRPRRKP